MITEGTTKIKGKIKEIVSRKQETFYNPVMKLNRDITIDVLNNYFKKKIKIALPLAASGIRAFRIIKEVKQVEEIYVNDIKKNFKKKIKEGIKLNNIKKEIQIENTEANIFLRRNCFFDYIDIDPYGSPMKFMQSAIAKIKHEGIIAITATDTSSLAGTYPRVCRRRYWAEPLRNYLKHEIGLRILIRAAQLIGTQQEKALIPILSYSKDHYYRVFFKVLNSKSECNKILKKHKKFQKAGPLWTGKLGDEKLIRKFPENKFYNLLTQDYASNLVGYFDTHEIGKELKKSVVKKEEILKKIKGYETHFSGTGIRTRNKKELLRIIRQLS